MTQRLEHRARTKNKITESGQLPPVTSIKIQISISTWNMNIIYTLGLNKRQNNTRTFGISQNRRPLVKRNTLFQKLSKMDKNRWRATYCSLLSLRKRNNGNYLSTNSLFTTEHKSYCVHDGDKDDRKSIIGKTKLRL